MTTISRKALEARKARWREFLAPGAQPGFMFYVHYQDPEAKIPPMPHLWPSRKKERVEFIWACYQQMRRQAAWLDDDLVPFLNMNTGTEVFAEAFGCKVHRPEDTNPSARPLIRSAGEVARLKVPELSTSSLAYLFDMADELQQRAGDDALFHLIDIQSPMDIAALIWEKSSFYMAFIEAPEAVRELAAKVFEFQTAFLDEWFSRYGHEYMAHFPSYFMSGGITLSEDEVGVVSPAVFEEFFLPELAALSERYGGIGIHCCADSRHQWQSFKKIPGLRLLNLVCPPTRKGAEFLGDAYAFFVEQCAQWHMGWVPPGEPEEQLAGYPAGSRVVAVFPAETSDQARELCRKLQAVREA